MRKIEVILKNGKYGVMDDGIEATPFIYHNQKDAIEEWEYFERENTEREPHRRFLNHVTSIEDIDTVVARYKDLTSPAVGGVFDEFR